MQKTSEKTLGFFCFSFNRELQRKPLGNATFLEKEEKTSEKNTEKRFLINL